MSKATRERQDNLHYFYKNSDSLKGLQIQNISTGTEYFISDEKKDKSSIVILSKANAPKKTITVSVYENFKITGFSACPQFQQGDKIVLSSDRNVKADIKRLTYDGYLLSNNAKIEYINQDMLELEDKSGLNQDEKTTVGVVTAALSSIDSDTSIAPKKYVTSGTFNKPEGNTSSNVKEGKTIMSNAKELLNQNTENLKLVAAVTAGKTLNKTAMNLITPRLPFYAQGLAKHPLATPVMANMIAMAIKQWAPTNDRAVQAADLMLQAAAFQAAEGFDIDGMIDELLAGITLPGEESSKKEETE